MSLPILAALAAAALTPRHSGAIAQRQARPDPREVDSPPPEYSLQCDYCGGMGASDTLGGSGPTLCESCEESL